MIRSSEKFLFVVSIGLAVLIVVGLSFPAFAQVPPGGGGNPCPGGEPCDPEVPISGIEWLLVIGGLLGLRKISTKFRKT